MNQQNKIEIEWKRAKKYYNKKMLFWFVIVIISASIPVIWVFNPKILGEENMLWTLLGSMAQLTIIGGIGGRQFRAWRNTKNEHIRTLNRIEIENRVK